MLGKRFRWGSLAQRCVPLCEHYVPHTSNAEGWATPSVGCVREIKSLGHPPKKLQVTRKKI